MPRRIGYGVRRMPSGRWQLLVRDPVSGKQIGMGTYADREMAERDGINAVADQHRGQWHDPRSGEVAVAVYLAEWLAACKANGRHGELYAVEAARLARLHISPHLGHVMLSDLRPMKVAAWHDKLVSARLKAGKPVGLTPAKAYRLLHAALADAVSSELIARNPAVKRSAGVEESPERPLLEPAQIDAIADAIRPWWRATVLMAAWVTLRFGELARLERRDVDLLHGTITVRKAKSRAGVRTISIPSKLVPVIEHHLATWSAPGPDGLVFVGPLGGPMRRPNFGADFRAAADPLGLTHVHFHDLRHAAGTMAAQTGATERELMARLGHASPNAAKRYQHAAQRRDVEIASRLDLLMGDVQLGSNAQPTRKRRQPSASGASDLG
jgi:integrase